MSPTTTLHPNLFPTLIRSRAEYETHYRGVTGYTPNAFPATYPCLIRSEERHHSGFSRIVDVEVVTVPRYRNRASRAAFVAGAMAEWKDAPCL